MGRHLMNCSSLARAGVLALAILVAGGAVTPAEATWSLVWSDEFNGTAVDADDWTHDIGTGCPDLCGWGNNELQYYRSQNVTVSGGNLVITSRAESYGGAAFTSGKIHSRGKHAFLYGRIEMRAKIPTGGGMWPAFWMMPEDEVYGGWAASGEIDIMESANATTSVGGALHYGGTWPSNTSTSGSYSLGGANFAGDFHIYAVEWEPDTIRWYVDGVLFMTRTSDQWYTNAAPGNPRAPFDQPFYIILNTAVGGNYTGCTDGGCVTASLPQQFLVDYVRVYEDIPNVAPTVALTSPAWGATVPAGDLTITADASDADGSVARVEFYAGATYLGADATAPYGFTWTAVADGCYEIVARVVDDLGGVGTDVAEVTVGAGCGQFAYRGAPLRLPARIEAEDYDVGGAGVAYHDLEAGNNGGQYRTGEGVDIESCSDAGGGYNLGWLNAGEWLEYTVDVPWAGQYIINARVASLSSGGAFRVKAGGGETGDIVAPVTGGWQSWTTVSTTATLAAGAQIIRFVAASGGFNLNYLEVASDLVAVGPAPAAAGYALHPCYPNPTALGAAIHYDLPQAEAVYLGVYDVSGRLVRTLVQGARVPAGKQTAAWNGRDDNGHVVPRGVYFYRLTAGAFSATRRVTLVN
jgi:beta-glucanase (GH16 family)